MSARRHCRAIAFFLLAHTIIRGHTAEELSMLVNLRERSSRTLPLFVRSQGGAFNLSNHICKKRGGCTEASTTVPSRELRRPMASASASAVNKYVENDQRDGIEGESRPPEAPPLGKSAHIQGELTGLARIVPAEEPWLTEAGTRLREGELVAFPTETVYGLGANALSESAVLKIFEAKKRPLTDPLIVHVPDTESALAFLDFGGEGGGGDRARRLFALLGKKLWPGPLTLILKASSHVPACVTASTGFVGVRCPAHPVTRQLLTHAGVPVAGPSANRFGHVSPTRAAHVTADLGDSDIMVVDGDSSGACGVGIESTVAKVDMENDRILILRMGGVTRSKLKEALSAGGAEFQGVRVVAGSVAGGKSDTGKQEEEAIITPSEGGASSQAEGQAPGQLLKHYSPDLDVFRVLGRLRTSLEREKETGLEERGNLAEMAKTSVVIDFAGQLKGLEVVAVAYLDLSVGGDTEEAAAGLFEGLRWAEGYPSVERLLISGLPSTSSGDLAAAVNDRIFRAASGKTISVEQET